MPSSCGAERVGHARLEPADHPRAAAGEDDALLPGLAQDRVEPVDAPDREHVRGVAAADPDHVLGERQLPEVLRRPREELEVPELAPCRGSGRRSAARTTGPPRSPSRRTETRGDRPGRAPEPRRRQRPAGPAADRDDVPFRHRSIVVSPDACDGRVGTTIETVSREVPMSAATVAPSRGVGRSRPRCATSTTSTSPARAGASSSGARGSGSRR